MGVIPDGNDNQPPGTFSDEAIRSRTQIAALQSHLASRTSSCIMCWTNGLRMRWGHVSKGMAPLSGMLTTRSWRSTTSSTPGVFSPCWASVLLGSGSRSIRTRHRSSTSAHRRRGRPPSGNGWNHLRLPRPDPRVGTVAERQEHGSADHGQGSFRPGCCRSERLVSETPTLVSPRAAPPPVLDDAGPLRLLGRRRQHATVAMVRQPSRADLAKVAVSARSSGMGSLDPC